MECRTELAPVAIARVVGHEDHRTGAGDTVAAVDLDQLSVVVPTYRRPVYALRNMRLLDQTGARVYVLDGSPDPIHSDQLAELSSRITYLHLPVTYEERYAHAAELIETPYCVSVGDDDMHLPSGLRAAVAALETDPELVSVTGTSCEVLVRDGLAYGRLKYEGLLDRAISDDNPIERMVDHLSRYMPSTVYAVARTSVWVRAVRALAGKRFPPFRLGELQQEMAVVYSGKTKTVPELMWLRSSENKSLWRDNDDLPVAPWWVQAHATGEREAFARYMAGALTDDPSGQAAAGQGALKAMDTYVDAVHELTATRDRLTAAERAERRPRYPILPLADWGEEGAKSGILADNDDLAVAAAAVESTPRARSS